MLKRTLMLRHDAKCNEGYLEVRTLQLAIQVDFRRYRNRVFVLNTAKLRDAADDLARLARYRIVKTLSAIMLAVSCVTRWLVYSIMTFCLGELSSTDIFSYYLDF